MKATLAPPSRNGHVKPAVVRVAIYCRVSNDERLGQEFNSLHNQRHLIESYVQSQQGKNWKALPQQYEDDVTGSTMERPALRQLLADVEAGVVDCVGVYKLDRLSRKQLHLLMLLDRFEEHQVSFVSVTEAFDTSTPIGRFTLQMLGAFAELERERIRERTRDKMSTARKRGFYQGGPPVLGYDVVEKKLVPNKDEVLVVRAIFEAYRSLGSLNKLVVEADARGWRNKRWTNKEGKTSGGNPFDKGGLQRLLTNPLFVGKVAHGGDVYPGQHPGIVDRDLWEAVQRQIDGHKKQVGPEIRNRHGALLRGKVRCAVCGHGMSHVAQRTRGEIYRYYVCDQINERGRDACPGSRVPAAVLEDAVQEKLATFAGAPEVSKAVLEAAAKEVVAQRQQSKAELRRLRRELGRSPEDAKLKAAVAALEAQIANLTGPLDGENVTAALADFPRLWAALTLGERTRLVDLIVDHVAFDSRTREVAVTFRSRPIERLASEKPRRSA